MIEAIQVAAMDAAKAAAPSNLTTSASQASGFDVHQFSTAMQSAGDKAGVGKTAHVDAAAATGKTEESMGVKALMETFGQLDSGARNIDAIAKTMSANAADLKPGEIMQMTMACHQFLFQTELTSNVANRTSDGIQQLFRQQS